MSSFVAPPRRTLSATPPTEGNEFCPYKDWLYRNNYIRMRQFPSVGGVAGLPDRVGRD